MVTKLNKNVFFLKDIPSNIIDEAIFILKPEEIVFGDKIQETFMIEAKDLIKKYSKKIEINRKLKNEKIIKTILSLVLILSLTVLLISFLIKFS